MAQPTLPPPTALAGRPQAQPTQPVAQPTLPPPTAPAGRLQAQPTQPVVQPTLPPPTAPAGQPQPPLQPAAPQRPAPAAIKLAGIWESQMTTGFGTMYSQMILHPNKSYSYQVILGDLMTWETGTYEPGEGFIHFSVLNYEPKVYKGTTMSRPTSWTVFYTVVDENTMIWEDRVLGTQWTVYRRR